MQKIMMTGIFDVKNNRIKNKITFEILLKYFKNKKKDGGTKFKKCKC